MKLFITFLKILGIGVVCSAIPFGPASMVFGFPAAFLASLIITLVFRKEFLAEK